MKDRTRRWGVVLLGLLYVGLAGWMIGQGCTTQPECRSDRDCVKLRGPEFLCYEQICRNQNAVLIEFPPQQEPKADSGPEPTPDAAPQDDPVAEKPVETKPELPRETGPETVPEGAGTLPVGAPCEDHTLASAQERCGPGLACVKLDSVSAYCLQDCSSNDQLCANNTDGRTVCKQVAWTDEIPPQPLSVCAKIAQKDEPCDPQQSIFCQRRTGSNHLVCTNGKCTAGVLCSAEGCSCGVNTQPPVECDVAQQLVCDYSTNKCVKGLRAYEGEACNRYRGMNRYCAVDHTCVTYGAGTFPDICLKLCNLNNPAGSCKHRSLQMTCIDVGKGQGGCIQTNCGAQKDCVFQTYPHFCKVDSSPNPRTCTPVPLPGKKAFAESCNNTDTCGHPFLCLAAYCTIQCRTDADCTPLHPKARCFLRNTMTNVLHCGFQCKDGCPSTMQCRAENDFCVGQLP